MLKMIISGVVLAGLVLGGMTMVCKKWIFK